MTVAGPDGGILHSRLARTFRVHETEKAVTASLRFGLLVFAVGLLVCWESAAQPPDDYALAVAAIEGKQYEKALSLLGSAIEENPGNAFAWYERGRVLAVKNRATLPDDYCDTDSNWIFLALGHLNEAMRLDAKGVSAKLEGDRTELAELMATPEFKLWWKALSPLPKGDQELRAFCKANPVWNREGTESPVRESLTLRADGSVELFSSGRAKKAGKWKVAGGKLHTTIGRRTASYVVRRVPFYLLNGSLSFETLQLGSTWTMGPILQDCSF